MTPEEIIKFYERRGSRVLRTASSWWYDEYHQRRIFYAFPTHRLISPKSDEIGNVFHNLPSAMAVRFLAPPDTKGKSSFMWVRRKPYDLSDLSGNTRSKTRRGLERCVVRAVPWEELVSAAWVAHHDTLQRHGRDTLLLDIDAELEKCSAFEAWGAFVEGVLAAYLITLWIEDWVHILINRSADAYLKFYPNNALVFSVVQQLLSRPGVSTMCYGWEPLSSLKSLEQFKLSMGFVQEPVRQRIVLRPWLRIFLNAATCSIVETIAAARPKDNRLERLAGFCRIVKEG